MRYSESMRHQFKRCVRLLLVILLMFTTPVLVNAEWDFSRSSIDVADIMSGGPPKDGIPALTDPAFIPAAEAGFMRDDEQILGVFLNGVAKAYPTRVLSWHELVNDRFGDLPVLVSW